MSNTQQKKRQRILNLARQGDPEILAALFNHRLRLQGITVEATLKQGCLYLLLEAKTTFNQEELIAFIQNTLNKLHPDSIQTVQISTSPQDQQYWSHIIKIAKSSDQETLDSPPTQEEEQEETLPPLPNFLSLQPIFEVEDQID